CARDVLGSGFDYW
nr:immunoglobulin heavy chain junction region [Macaca mulatta]